MTAGFFVSLPMTSPKWSATCPTVLCAKTSGWALASSTVSDRRASPVSAPCSRPLRTRWPSGPSCWAAATARG